MHVEGHGKPNDATVEQGDAFAGDRVDQALALGMGRGCGVERGGFGGRAAPDVQPVAELAFLDVTDKTVDAGDRLG